MQEIETKELECIIGGLSISGSLITAFTKAITTVYDIGRSLGTALRRVASKGVCPVK